VTAAAAWLRPYKKAGTDETSSHPACPRLLDVVARALSTSLTPETSAFRSSPAASAFPPLKRAPAVP
jgi:hypothetical protein